MQPAELTVENADMSTSLGAGFWTGWAAGMAATLGAFAGAVYLFMHSGSPGGPMVGGVIVVAFTLALIAIANIPNMIRRKRGFGGEGKVVFHKLCVMRLRGGVKGGDGFDLGEGELAFTAPRRGRNRANLRW